MGWDGSVCWYENEFHVTVTCQGKIYSHGQAKTLTAALDECSNGFGKVGG